MLILIQLGKPHYVDFVKSGANWIQHDDEMVQKNSLKSVLEVKFFLLHRYYWGKIRNFQDSTFSWFLFFFSNIQLKLNAGCLH